MRLVRAGVLLVDDVGTVDHGRRRSTARPVRLDGGRVLLAGTRSSAPGTCSGRTRSSGAWRRRGPASAPSSSASPRTRSSTCGGRPSSCSRRSTLPKLRTSFAGRHALVVVRGHDYKQDLRVLRSYIREFQPVLIGVDGGADALLEVGLKPDIILGDFDSVSARAMDVGAEHVHHVHPDGRNPGFEELQAFGKPYEEFVVEGTSEDAAMLLAYEAGAKLIVAVGTHDTMVEFLDKGRAGMSSTFLTRLRLGPDAGRRQGRGPPLRAARCGARDLLAAGAGRAGSSWSSSRSCPSPLQVILDGVWLTLRDLWFSITGTF